ncbi:MAG: phosphoglucosamine mutase [Coriobacteriales bacterium]|jgi:phosphoglucosamine mutase
MAKRLFGTDGVRGIANTDLTAKLAFDLGRAAVEFLGKELVIGKDTRRSGDVLEASIAAGIMSAGGNVHLAGVIPTPAIALLTRTGDYDGGIVISASHNPPRYNGIKFFNADGFKLPDALEDEMQAFIESGAEVSGDEVVGELVGKALVIDDAMDRYVAHAVEPLLSDGIDLSGMKIVVDCGHGAACRTTPEALRRLGADVIAMNTDYSGDDINVECGSTNLGAIKGVVAEHGAALGLAHDGDADRLLAVDELGNEVDGDQIEAICAIDLKDRGKLKGNAVVSTVMCNLGLIRAMKREGIELEQTKVGDRYVLECMQREGYILGGEQSGHMIFLEQNTTGDGLVTALNLLSVMVRSGKPLSALATAMERFPQSLINVEVGDKEIHETSEAVIAAIDGVKERLGDNGHVLVRASGTEQCIRVMVEATEDETAYAAAREIADAIEAADRA